MHLKANQASARTGRAALLTLIDAVVLTPKKGRPGMDIDLEGRLENIVNLATGEKPVEREGMLLVVAEEGLEPPTRGL